MASFKFIVVCILLGAGCAKKTQPAGGNDLAGTGTPIRILCYNIHHANPPSRPNFIDMEAIAKVINEQRPHLVALQEVDVYTGRSGKNLHQAEELARLTGMKAFFARAINYDGGEYGVAILSKFPMEEMSNHPLPTAAGTGGEPRTLAKAVITLPGGKKMVFASTHLDAQKKDTNRLLQIREITRLLKEVTLPVVLAGDLNAEPGTAVINHLDAHLTRSCLKNCGFTIPQINPNRTIDFIAYAPKKSFRVLEHRVIAESYASDHLPLLVVLQQK
jgi:endonuclease/exonuclease/phosphatase family metal-dependent hydrolase